MYRQTVAQVNAKGAMAPPAVGGLLQRACACGQHTSGGECEECSKKKLAEESAGAGSLNRRASTPSTPGIAPPIVHDVLRSPGQPLDTATRQFFEPRFGQDFSHVRVHTDARAAESARAVNALAYTVGTNVVFGSGQYSTNDSTRQRLLAHELTHVVQQAGMATVSSELRIGPEHDPAETEAEGVALRTWRSQELRFRRPPVPSPISTGFLRRAAIHTGRILDEGTCADLVAGSRFICCDPDNGIERKGKKKDIEGNDCPNEKFTPVFTCDKDWDGALNKGCDDADNWMAMPHKRFARRKCGQDLVICANGNFTHAYVRDRSDKQAWEVSRAIPSALGVSPDFSGAIYGDENDPDFKKDKRCRSQTPTPTPQPQPSPGSGGAQGPPYVGDVNEPIPE